MSIVKLSNSTEITEQTYSTTAHLEPLLHLFYAEWEIHNVRIDKVVS